MKREVNVNLILEFRKTTEMSVKEFCEQSNIGTTTYYKIIKGESIKIETSYGIARTMNVSITDLLK